MKKQTEYKFYNVKKTGALKTPIFIVSIALQIRCLIIHMRRYETANRINFYVEQKNKNRERSGILRDGKCLENFAENIPAGHAVATGVVVVQHR